MLPPTSNLRSFPYRSRKRKKRGPNFYATRSIHTTLVCPTPLKRPRLVRYYYVVFLAPAGFACGWRFSPSIFEGAEGLEEIIFGDGVGSDKDSHDLMLQEEKDWA